MTPLAVFSFVTRRIWSTMTIFVTDSVSISASSLLISPDLRPMCRSTNTNGVNLASGSVTSHRVHIGLPTQPIPTTSKTRQYILHHCSRSWRPPPAVTTLRQLISHREYSFSRSPTRFFSLYCGSCLPGICSHSQPCPTSYTTSPSRCIFNSMVFPKMHLETWYSIPGASKAFPVYESPFSI